MSQHLLSSYSGVVQLLSHVLLFVTPWTAAHQASQSFTISRTCSISCLLSWWCHPTISHYVLPFFSCIQYFPTPGSFLMSQFFAPGGPKYWSFNFSIRPSKEYSGLISFRMDWVALLAVRGTLRSILQYHSSKASIFWCSAFYMVQQSHPYMTTGKTIALTRWTFVSPPLGSLALSFLKGRCHGQTGMR